MTAPQADAGMDERPFALSSDQGASPEPVLPHSIDLEQALLGACLINPQALDFIVGKVDAEDFFEQVHETLFGVLRRARDAGRAMDIRLAASSFGADVHVELVPGMTIAQYFARLAAEAVTVVNAPDYADEIRRLADRRRAISTAMIVIEEARRDGCDPRLLVEDAIADLDAIAAARATATERQVSIAEAVETAYATAVEAQNPRKQAGLTTGLADLNRALAGGLFDGDLIILGGRPGMGKTTVALKFLMAAAKSGVAGYFSSLEMDQTQLGLRALSAMAASYGHLIPYNALRGGTATREELDAIGSLRPAFNDLPIRIEQKGGLTIQQIAARARIVANRYAARGQKLGLLVIDHLGLVKPSNRYAGKRYDEVTELSGTLKPLAKELGLPIVALAQLNRMVETRTDKQPQLSDLRESGAIEQDADVVLFAYREAYYLEHARPKEDDGGAWLERLEQKQNELELIIGKQRMGPTKTIRAYCNIACNHIADLEQRSFM